MDCAWGAQDIFLHFPLIYFLVIFQSSAVLPSTIWKIVKKIELSKTESITILGLVDGDMNYPFDVNQAILWLGELVDLIFVFFDPIGQVCITIPI